MLYTSKDMKESNKEYEREMRGDKKRKKNSRRETGYKYDFSN
jgi:hypothetical protein